MAIEKAFAMRAPPAAIFAAIERDLLDAAPHYGDTFEVVRSAPPAQLDLRVTIAGVPCWLSYVLSERDGCTEVSARLTPFGLKYGIFRIISFGMRDQNFAVVLVESLANLKAAVEQADADAEPATAADGDAAGDDGA